MRAVRVLFPIFVLYVLIACAGQRSHERALQNVRSIINEYPDSALRLLDSMEVYSDDFSESIRMQWLMLQLSAQNKCYIDFHSDSLHKILVDYFDHHGTSNERMTAHYLLGRAYSDMGEAPMALRCYQDAVECADTMATDCDFYTLCSVYGQMATMFNAQHLPKEAIESWERYSHFAQRDHDTFSFIKGKELQIPSYYHLNDTANCLKLTEECHHLYIVYGYPEEAASVYPTAILILLRNGQWQRAHQMMQEYEGKSGLFDDDGNIASGREKYYYSKGLYYMETHRVDSAEYFFRKLLGFQHNRNYDAYKGLHAVYHERRNVDSIMKYSTLCEQALDSIQADDQSDAMIATHSLYNYSRQEKMAGQKALEAEQTKWRMKLVVSIVLFLAVLLFFFFYQRYKRLRLSKEKELGQMNSDYLTAVSKYEQIIQELQVLEVDKEQAIQRKQEEISKLLGQIDRYKKLIDELPDHDKEAAIMGSDIVLSFHKMAKGNRDAKLPTDGDWQRLMGMFAKSLPTFYEGILTNNALTKLEKQICMLCRLNFSNGQISLLLCKSTQSVTNTKTKVNIKLFGQKSASSLKKNIMKM